MHLIACPCHRDRDILRVGNKKDLKHLSTFNICLNQTDVAAQTSQNKKIIEFVCCRLEKNTHSLT